MEMKMSRWIEIDSVLPHALRIILCNVHLEIGNILPEFGSVNTNVSQLLDLISTKPARKLNLKQTYQSQLIKDN